jgi:uncharacterized protein involved in exopolysaccharide biosynthesis
MLQKLNFEDDGEAADRGQQFRPASYQEEADQSYFLQPSFYWQLIKRRALYFVIPFILVLVVGLAVALLLPATYVSEGKILVQSQQIPTELVRPTVTSAAQERIQVIEQRTMTRENLLAIIDKFQLFPEKRTLMSASQLVELMRKNAKIEPLAQPLAFSQVRSRGDNPTIVFTVGFEYSDPQTASRVANELVTRILNEDLRDRTSRATDTTKFLAREVQKLQAENAAIDAKIALAKLSQAKSGSNTPDQPATQLAQLKMDLTQKSALYSDRHPVMQALKRQIAALEKVVVPPVQTGPDALAPLDELETQQENIQKNLEAASTKLAAARLGETLEKDQQSEKLEVIEQPTAPQEPIRPNRPKIAGIALFLALAAGGGLVFLLEFADKGIRRSSDIFGIVDSRLVIAIPYITTHAERGRQKSRTIVLIGVAVVLVVGALVAAYLFMPPLDLMIAKARVGLFK